MNALTHTRMNLELLQEFDISVNKHLVVLGGVLPDLSELGIIPLKPAHEHSLAFIDYLRNKDPKMVGLGFGFMLHGESPCGLDFYTHRDGGFIDQNEMEMYTIIHKHKPKLNPQKQKQFAHTLIEFAVDSHADEKYALFFNEAVRTQDLDRIAFHIYNFFGGNPRKIRSVLHFLRRLDARRLLQVERVAKYWKNWMAFQNLSHGSYVKNYLFFTQAVTLTRKKTLVNMLREARQVIYDPYESFFESTKKQLAKTFFKPFDVKVLQNQLNGDFNQAPLLQ